MDAETKGRLAILGASFVIAAFAGLAAHLRTLKYRSGQWAELVLGIAAAVSNGGVIGIITCGFCYWKYNGSPDMFVVFMSAAAVSLGGLEMVNLVLRRVRHHLGIVDDEKEGKK